MRYTLTSARIGPPDQAVKYARDQIRTAHLQAQEDRPTNHAAE
ncbi:MAG: hypothetical protein OEV40_29230 [Acidimicrobiia bacterium]|nr:hypothetical protein [Acidimicrobiia bacterium]